MAPHTDHMKPSHRYLGGGEDYLTHKSGGYVDLTANRTAVLDQGGNYSTELFANVSIDRIRDYAATTAAAATATAAAAAAAVESSASTAAAALAAPAVVASALAAPPIAPTPFFLYLAMQVRRGDERVWEGGSWLLCRGCVVACVVVACVLQ